jgi:homoserine O-acetyltransferase
MSLAAANANFQPEEFAPDIYNPCLEGKDIFVPIPDEFRLQSGERLTQTHYTARVYGRKNAPAIIAAGGISSDRVLYTLEESGANTGWWSSVAGPGLALDPECWRILSFDFAPNSPCIKPFTISTADQARLIALLLDHLNIRKIYCFLGASYGGMIALAFAAAFPERVERLCVFSAAHRAHPMATAMRGLQRRILQFGKETGRIKETVCLARELAMTTYRTLDEFAQRFDASPPSHAGDPYPVCNYLIARGHEYDLCPNRWIALSDSMDRHCVNPAKIKARTVLAAVPDDRLVPYSDIAALNDLLGERSQLISLPSLYGHDAFLKEPRIVSAILRTALRSKP